MNESELIGIQEIATYWQLIPLRDKSPAIGGNDWYNKDFALDEILKLITSKKATGLGVKLGIASNGLMCVDIDGQPAIDLLKADYPPLPQTVSSTSREGNEAHYYLVPNQYWELLKRDEIKTGKTYIKANGKETESKIELRWGIMQQALPPSIHPDTGEPYKWIHSPKDIAVAIVPEWMLELMSPNYEDTKSLVPQPSIPRIISSYSGKPSEADRAREFLKYIDASRADGYGDWIGVGMTLASIDDSLLPDWIEFSRRSPKFVNEHDCEKRWKSANWKKDNFDHAMGKLCNWAKAGGWKPKPKSERSPKNGKRDKIQPLTRIDIAKLDGIDVKDEKYFVNLSQVCDRQIKNILQGKSQDIDQDKLIATYKELKGWENVLLKFSPDTIRYCRPETMMRNLCNDRLHLDIDKALRAIPNQDSLLPSLHYTEGDDAINQVIQTWKMKITPYFEEDNESFIPF